MMFIYELHHNFAADISQEHFLYKLHGQKKLHQATTGMFEISILEELLAGLSRFV